MSASNFDDHFPADKFILLPNVPLIDENTRRTKDGRTVKIDADVLHKMAKVNNRRWEETCDAAPAVVGHTPDEEELEKKGIVLKESDQPEIVGWSVNYKVAPFFKTGRKALFADLYIRREHEDKIHKYPRRSIEYWPGSHVIDPVSLLSATTPERDLSILKFHQSDPRSALKFGRDGYKIRYLLNPTPTPETASPMTDAELAPAQAVQTEAFKQLADSITELAKKIDSMPQVMVEGMHAALSELLGDEGQGAGGGDDQEDLLAPADDGDELGAADNEEGDADADADPTADTDEGDEDPADEDEESKEPEKMSADATSTNVFIPTTGKQKMSKTSDDAAVKFKKELDAMKAAHAKELEAVKATHAAFAREQQVKFQRAKAEKTITQLKAAPFAIDFGGEEGEKEEIDLLAQLRDDSFTAHVEKIKKRYKRVLPDSEGVDEVQKYARQAGETGALQTPADLDRFVQALDANPGISLEDALNKLGKKK